MTERNTYRPTGAHLVGSIPVDTAEAAFRLAMEHMGNHLQRLPDGEIGERDTWVRWQHAKIGASPQLKPSAKKPIYVPVQPFEVMDGITSAEQIEFPSLGYADAAIASFHDFERLVGEGVIPGDMRFQVGLPTPAAVSLIYIEADSRALFDLAYERSLRQELERMLGEIPAERLAIQWETVTEFALLEGMVDSHFGGDTVEAIADRVAVLIDLVPAPAHAGLHLCYGDSGHKHFCEPTNAGYLAAVSNEILGRAGRPVNWIHMPVPKERDDIDYFRPLADLRLPEGTDLYLGLVHQTGGQAGTERRIEAAATVVPRFGVATECGFGRREAETVAGLMQQHAAVADPVRT
jgi:hypothetical protein